MKLKTEIYIPRQNNFCSHANTPSHRHVVASSRLERLVVDLSRRVSLAAQQRGIETHPILQLTDPLIVRRETIHLVLDEQTQSPLSQRRISILFHDVEMRLSRIVSIAFRRMCAGNEQGREEE